MFAAAADAFVLRTAAHGHAQLASSAGWQPQCLRMNCSGTHGGMAAAFVHSILPSASQLIHCIVLRPMIVLQEAERPGYRLHLDELLLPTYSGWKSLLGRTPELEDARLLFETIGNPSLCRLSKVRGGQPVTGHWRPWCRATAMAAPQAAQPSTQGRQTGGAGARRLPPPRTPAGPASMTASPRRRGPSAGSRWSCPTTATKRAARWVPAVTTAGGAC